MVTVALFAATVSSLTSALAKDVSPARSSDHWSFQPIQRPAVPQVEHASWVRNPIDAFVLARLEARGITPSPEADRAMLIRRLYLDLLGLPPSPEAVNQFLQDQRPGAYERLVERLLSSKHYGERWGRHWLDLARYADSDGYEKDRPRPHAWRYRHWVIDALNADMPFDEFSIRQLAGDMLRDAGIEHRVASGFHRNTLHNTEGGTDQEEDRVKKTVDRTNTFGTIWLGLTVGCAECHSHKYDPLSHREYYSLYGFFNHIDETEVSAPLSEEAAHYVAAQQAFAREHEQYTAAIAAYEEQSLPAAQAEWEATALEKATSWTPLQPTSLSSAEGAKLTKQEDASILAGGNNELSDVYTVQATTAADRITAIRLEVLPEKGLPKEGPGRSENGNFVLTRFRVAAKDAQGQGSDPFSDVTLARARANFSQQDWDVALAINDSAEDGWAISPQFGKRHVAVFEFAEPISFTTGAELAVVLEQHYTGDDAHNIGRFRLSVTGARGEIQLEDIPQEVVRALAALPQERSDQERQVIAAHYRSLDPRLAELEAAAAEHAKTAPAPPGTKARAVVERKDPRATHVHLRGNFLDRGELVHISTPSVLPVIEPRGERPDRLDLARWLFSADNPLTARVTVNRIWQRYLGRGLVATSDDFGTQGEPPSHPQLLDWLACELRENGWRLKTIHRLIVTSSTYRQTSAARLDLEELDPENTLLARQTRRRVEAEIVRDLALCASGLLDRRVGGPSVRPPQPAEYSNLTYANSARWQTSEGPDRYRRGIYTFFQRTSPYPMLMTFDAPDSNECTAERPTSNTPLQALTLWNDPVFFECAQALGRRVVREIPSSSDPETTSRARAHYVFQLCLARPPEEGELQTVIDLFEQQLQLCRADAEAAGQLVGERAAADGESGPELAAWIFVGRTLINLDEFVTRE